MEMEKEHRSSHPRLVLVALPFQGHINPMLQLGSILHSKGFSITVLHTAFNSPIPSNYPEFGFVSIPDNLSEQLISADDLLPFISLLNLNCGVPFQECLAKMVQKQEVENEPSIACIVYDECMYFCDAVAKYVKLPSIVLRTTSASTYLSRNAILQLKAEGVLTSQGSTSQDLVPGLHPLRFKDLPVSKIGTPEIFLQFITNIYKTRTSSAIIWNTNDVLEQPSLQEIQKQCQVGIFPVGPLHEVAPASSSLIKEDNSCITWLEKQKQNTVLYVSLGSVASVDKKELGEMAWGLANSKQPFLWVIRPGSVDDQEWKKLSTEGFVEAVGENGCIVKWAPQKEVLAHGAVGGFWTHCGWNSTLESISKGVPMICKPCFGDQRVNARHVSQVWRIGIQLENMCERGEVERAIKRLMVDKEGKEMRQRAKNLKERIQLDIREGGSSYNYLNKLIELIMSF
ncbi:UDP-glycosyltransferase 76E2 [Gossypium raimondii]|uniref:Glycosyltransferase n=1 Tax=Gossypium raimondii TaxID=29730 RepID=A0A0D2LXF3_GOSRA|nr:UDP-glycosyltransferase 76E2 [Gossypium raimondii]KJB08922.1 hypothetical protein B456_001G113300 [Gossypium raimondii]MBA0578736.1 hypothetical protein [Gossypium raimondii]